MEEIPPPTACKNNVLLSSDDIFEAIRTARKNYRQHGKGNAYALLLKQFHAIILPAVFTDTGNLSKASQILGIQRNTVRKYAIHSEACERWVDSGK